MNTRLSMQTRVRDFLAERRCLGFELTKMGLALRNFARYIDARGCRGPLTVEIMAEWARRGKLNSQTPITWARRLKLLRPFARYLQQFEPRTEVPDESIFGPVNQRLAPHIYSEQEIKGRKQRSVPLWKSTVQAVRAWLRRNPTLGADAALLPNRDGKAMTRSNVTQRLDIAVARAAKPHPSLLKRNVSPHTIRHYAESRTITG